MLIKIESFLETFREEKGLGVPKMKNKKQTQFESKRFKEGA